MEPKDKEFTQPYAKEINYQAIAIELHNQIMLQELRHKQVH